VQYEVRITITNVELRCGSSESNRNIVNNNQARREPQRVPRETIVAGPYHNDTTSFRMRRDRDAEGVEGEETWGRLSPHHPTRGLGSMGNSPSGVRGGAPTANGFYAYLRSERNRLKHLFAIFGRWWAPQTSRGPGKLSTLSPTRRV